MSIPALLELNNELKRLAVAGAALAQGDFRMKRLIPPLQKSGASVPVFARAAELAERLTADDEPDRAARMLELANLVNAVLSTQGQAAPSVGDFVSFEYRMTEFSAFLPYRKLKPVEDALTQSSSGRMEVLWQAETEGAFRDFRLAAPLVAALSDNYAEIGAFAVERLAGYGREIVPYLKKGFDPKGGKPHARCVEAVAIAAGGAGNDWYRSVAESADGPVKAEAVHALRFCPENEDLLISYTFDRKKEVREAAFTALGAFGSEAAAKRLAEAFDGKERSAAMAGISLCPAASLTEHIMHRADTILAGLAQSGRIAEAQAKKTAIPADDAEAAAFSDALAALRHKSHPDLLALYVSMERFAAHMTWLAAAPATGFGTAARQWAGNMLFLGTIHPDGTPDAHAGPPERFALLDGLLGRFNNYFADYAFAAAVASLRPEVVYERYSPVLKAGKKDTAAGTLLEIFLCVARFAVDVPIRERYTRLDAVEFIKAANPAWDARWLDTFISADAGELAARFARAGHKKCGDYLVSKLEHALQNPREEPGPWPFVAGLLQMAHPKAPELALNALETRLAVRDWLPKYDAAVLRLLPGDCSAKMLELATKVDDRLLADLAEQVKQNPAQESKKRFGLF